MEEGSKNFNSQYDFTNLLVIPRKYVPLKNTLCCINKSKIKKYSINKAANSDCLCHKKAQNQFLLNYIVYFA